MWASLLRPRLARRAAQLERAAVARAASAAERDAVTAACENRREARASRRAVGLARKASAEEARRVRRAEAEVKVDRVAELHAEFRALSTFRRRQFLKTIAADIPERAFLDLHAATPPRRVEYDHADIYLRVLTKGEEFRLRGCLKEPFTVEWIQNQVGPGDVLYDIGANVGVYSLVAAKKKSGGARVFAFEASYATVASLAANIVLNGAAEAITPLPVALSNATEMNVFDLRDLEPGAASHALGAPAPDGGAPRYRQPVMTFRLDDLVELLRLPSPNHIKLDVDGGELAVLEGARRTLSSPDLRSLLVEVSTADSAAVTRMLADHGLHVDSKITLKRKTGEDHVVWYGLFTRDGRGAAGAT
jgi:FkbM family methyltransferase